MEKNCSEELTKEEGLKLIELAEKCEEDDNYIPTEEEMELLYKIGFEDETKSECECNEEITGVPVDFEKVVNLPIDAKSYRRGIEEASYIVGFVSALRGVDYPTDLIHQLVINMQTCESNEKVSKYGVLTMEKNTI